MSSYPGNQSFTEAEPLTWIKVKMLEKMFSGAGSICGKRNKKEGLQSHVNCFSLHGCCLTCCVFPIFLISDFQHQQVWLPFPEWFASLKFIRHLQRRPLVCRDFFHIGDTCCDSSPVQCSFGGCLRTWTMLFQEQLWLLTGETAT